MKEIANALLNASKAIKNIPAAPVFNGEALKKAFTDAGLPEKFIQSALEESKKKHEETHGNSEEKFARVVIAEIAPALGGIETFAALARKMNTQQVESSKVKFTKGDLNDKENVKAQNFIKQVQALYKAGKQVSEIENELNFYSYQTLYSFVKENETLFPNRK